MKQAGHCWWLHLLGILEKLGFTSCEVNMSLYVFRKDETIIAMWIQVDDGMIASNLPKAIKQFREALCSNFEIKWRIIQCNSPLLPIPTMTSNVKGIVMDTRPFRLVIGLLAHLVSGSRPDLVFAMNYLARHSTALMATHWDVLDHHIGYLLKTWGHGIILRPAEYIALSNSTQHLVQAINQLTQLAQDFKKTIFCDNQAAVEVSIKNLSCKCMRYLDRAFFFVNNVIHKQGIMVRWVKTWEMQADAFTKRLSGQSLNQALYFLSITGNR
ncbi:hypothetical protein O181_057881 [Austropuccinia psidii MF-1]|uniref:Reverse transcriptase Ty1/copia-type domain-containing protein n=1 Tax=Austropuccinia psidii MF-1 TaxID=1389203 RepID=A0A9Q3EFZ5_9BASI|nr:hypothetical protein [Austropuccinia psidii MF-1]